MMLISFCQYLAEDNCQEWKEAIGNYVVKNTKAVNLILKMLIHMINDYEWNRSMDIDSIDRLTERNQPHQFAIAMAIIEFLTELMIGPCYSNIIEVTKN